MKLRTGNEMPAYRAGLVAVLDVGSSKTVCLIGRAEPGSLRVVGAALRESQGIRAGTVVGMEHAEESIRDAVAAAENHADLRIQNVIISVNCGQPVSVTSRAAMALDGALVSDAHLRALLQDGRSRCVAEGHELIQSAPTTYVVDEARGVRNPLGMFCQRIGVAMHAVAVKPSPLNNLKLAVERCHLNVVGTQFGAYASGLATPDRRREAARRHRHRHGRRRHLHRGLPRRPSRACRRRADGRPAGHHRPRPHARGADLGRRARQDLIWRRPGRHGGRRRRHPARPDGRGGRGRRHPRPPAPCSPASSRPGSKRPSASSSRGCAPAASTWRRAAAPCSPAAPASSPACASSPAASSTSRCASAARKASRVFPPRRRARTTRRPSAF
ncbi:MAG: cell division protein FtsA [Rhizomicrobium sp.]